MTKIILTLEFDGRTVQSPRVFERLEQAMVEINRSEHATQVVRDRPRYERNPFPIDWKLEVEPS